MSNNIEALNKSDIYVEEFNTTSFNCVLSKIQGNRSSMEDNELIKYIDGIYIIGLFDGHGGDKISKSLPNIIWYCTDQQRYDTIASLGNDFINTPNIDKFIKNGFAYKNAYVQSPICTPSRSSFLTGRYPATTHAHRNGADYFPPNEILISKMLKDAGYDCGLVGKLHLAAADGGVEKRSDDGYRVFQYSHDSVAGKINVESNDYKKWLKEEKKV